jgi:hypothetical protein
MSPNVNLNLSTSLIILIGSIAFSYFTHIGWWAIGGICYFLFGRLSDDYFIVAKWFALSFSLIFFIIAILRMGWSFSLS